MTDRDKLPVKTATGNVIVPTKQSGGLDVEGDMAERSSVKAPGAEGSEEAAPQSNADRLRAHIKPDGLASTLVDAWLAVAPADAQTRLLKALEDYHKPKQGTDDGQASED